MNTLLNFFRKTKESSRFAVLMLLFVVCLGVDSTQARAQDTDAFQQGIDLSQLQVTTEAIIGQDDQELVSDTTLYPYRTVVHLLLFFNGSVHQGTGVLVGANTVLTAAHNVYNRDQKQWAYQVQVTPGKNGETLPYGTYLSDSYVIPREYKSATQGTRYDIAVLRLKQSVPDSVGVTSLSPLLASGDSIQIAGYPGETAEKVGYMHTHAGNVLAIDDTLLTYEIDTEPGNSGSPILNANQEVVGIHSSTVTTQGGEVYNLGRRVDAFVLQMVAHMAADKTDTLDIASNSTVDTGIVYRLYLSEKSLYVYTRHLDEALLLTQRGYRFEGHGFTTDRKGIPVYRFYNASRKTYVYTSNEVEKSRISETGWTYEGIAWYSSGSNRVYRLFNPTSQVHMYTANLQEVAILKARGWKYEGVAFYTIR